MRTAGRNNTKPAALSHTGEPAETAACIGSNRRRVLLASMMSATAVAALLAVVPGAWAQQATATGEVRRVDTAAGTVTIKHEEITALGLPAMTLVYQAAPALLQNVKPGDKVRFTATRQGGKYIVTAIDKGMF